MVVRMEEGGREMNQEKEAVISGIDRSKYILRTDFICDTGQQEAVDTVLDGFT